MYFPQERLRTAVRTPARTGEPESGHGDRRFRHGADTNKKRGQNRLALSSFGFGLVVGAVQLQHGSKGLAGELHAAQLAHLLLAFLLLFQ